MGTFKQQAFSNSLIYYFGVFLGYLNVVVLFPKFFGPEQFGLTRLLLSFSMILSMVSHFGFTNVTIRYFPFFKDHSKKHQGFLFLILLIPVIGFVLVSGVFFLGEPLLLKMYEGNSPLFVENFWWIFPITFLLVYFEILFSYSKALFKSIAPLFFKEVGVRLVVTIAIILSGFEFIGFQEFLGLFTAAYGFPVVGMMVYLGSIGQLFFKPDFTKISFSHFKQMLNYGIFTLGFKATGVINRRIDVMMLGSFISDKSVAIYTIAYYISNVIIMPKRGILHIAGPIVADAFARNDMEHIRNFYKRTSLNQMLVGALIFMVIWFNVENIFSLINKAYSGGILVVFYIGLGQLLNMSIGTNNEIMIHSVYYRYNIWFMAFLLALTVILNWILIPIWGIEGAAIGTALALFLHNLAKAVFIWFKYRFHPLSLNHLTLIAIIAVTALIGSFLPDFQVEAIQPFLAKILNIILKALVISLIYGTLILTLKPSADVSEALLKVKRRFFD